MKALALILLGATVALSWVLTRRWPDPTPVDGLEQLYTELASG